MAFIDYLPQDAIPPEHRVDDLDNIIQIHGVHSEVMPRHLDLYQQLRRRRGPLRRAQREMIAVVVSVANHCRY